MGFKDMPQRRIIDIVEYNNMPPNEMVHKFPEYGVADIQWGAQLIVQQTQMAVFFKDGKALDTFGPGRHTLTTNNIPYLSDLVQKFTQGGKTPFQAEVYFVNTKVFQDMKWGTPEPIDLQDPDLGWVQIKAFGTYSIRVSDPQLFVNTLVGSQGMMETPAIEKFLKGSIRTHFNDLLSTNFKSYAKIRQDMEELSAGMKFKVKEDFEKYGLEIRDFFLQNLSVPEEIQQAFRERARMGALGDMGKFMQYKAATAMGDMATRPAGTGTDPMSAGMGMGMGMMMPQMMAQSMQGAMGGQQMGYAQGQQPMQQQPMPPQTPPPPQAMGSCPNCQAQINPNAKFCPNCGQPTAPPKPKCPGCQGEVIPGARFCPNCGQPLQPAKPKCPNCQAEVPPGTKFCPECGTKV